MDLIKRIWVQSSTDAAAKLLLAVDFHGINSFRQVAKTPLQSEKKTLISKASGLLQISDAMYFDGEGVVLFI